ncbi:MAG: hypothetical protein RR369_04340 [Lachnospiraceae bacterium]
MAALNRQTYMYGNAATQPEIAPRRWEEAEPLQPKKVSKQVRRNRKKAMRINSGYVVFLTVAAVLALVVCVNYLHLQSEMVGHSKQITVLQQELSSIKEENNTKYSAVMNSVSLEDVRNKAMNELGMVHVTPEQIVSYQNRSGDDVKQYEGIPKSGVLASSRRIEK